MIKQFALAGACLLSPAPLLAQAGAGDGAARSPAGSDDAILLTVFLKHDQSKTVGEINERLFRQGFYDKFPPPGIEVVSWYVMMGIGQVVTLRVPASRLREVNVALESSAWGGYHTEFYPTYDYKGRAEDQRRVMQARPHPQPDAAPK